MPARSLDPADAYEYITETADGIKRRALAMAANVPAAEGRDVLQLYRDLGAFRTKLLAARDRPKLLEYVRTRYQDTAADIVADVTAFVAQITSFIDLVDANFPQSADGYWKIVTTANGVATFPTLATLFSAGQRTGLTNQLNALATAAGAIA